MASAATASMGAGSGRARKPGRVLALGGPQSYPNLLASIAQAMSSEADSFGFDGRAGLTGLRCASAGASAGR